jgi:hypothetical protein
LPASGEAGARRDDGGRVPRLERAGAGRQVTLGAFGLSLLSEPVPPGAWEPRAPDGPLLSLRLTDREAIAQSWSGTAAIGWQGTIDGACFVIERGAAGDHRFLHGPGEGAASALDAHVPPPHTRAVHHLSADAGLLICAPADPSDPAWWRLVLDSVLFTTALLHGYEALHAAAVATPQGAVAITAGTGGGKSTLLSELLLGGMTLMADDVLVLQPRDGQAPLAYPAPPMITVPEHRTAALAALDGGAPQTICTVADENWLAVPVHPGPLPLRALVVLNRRPGLATGVWTAQRPLAALIESLLRFPRTRERERFELAGAIAERVPIWRLDADPSVTPPELAERLLGAIDVSSPRDPAGAGVG